MLRQVRRQRGVVLFIALIGAIIWKANHKAPPKAEAAPQSLGLGLPQDADIRSASLDGDRLVISTAREVIVVDAAHDGAAITAAVNGRAVTAVVCTHGHNDHVKTSNCFIL